MLGYAEAQHRTVVIVDVAGFTAANRRGVHQVEIHKRLVELLTAAFDDAGIPWQDCDVEDRGDGKLILAPRDVFNIRLVDQLWSRLLAELRRYNALHSAGAVMQLRVAVHAGEVWRGPAGEVSPAINLTARIIEAAPAKDVLKATGAVLAMIASDAFYRDVIEPDPAAAPDLFRRIPVEVKQTQTHAWLRVSELPSPSAVQPQLELEELAPLLDGVSVPHLPVLVGRASGPGVPPAPPGSDAWASVCHLAEFNAGADGVPPALVFLDLLAGMVDRERGEQLARWIEDQARRLGLEAELGNRPAARKRLPDSESRLHLLIAVQPDGVSRDQVLVSHWRQDDPDVWPPACGEPTTVAVDQLEQHVDDLVVGAEIAWERHDGPVTVELLLPRALLNLPVHAWQKEHRSGDPRPLSLDYPVVVRSLERMMSKQWHRAWKTRWSAFVADPAGGRVHVAQPPDPDRPHLLGAALQDDPAVVTVVLTGPPPASPDRGDELLAALRSGLPGVLWHRDGADPKTVGDLVSGLIEDGGLMALPENAHKARRRGHQSTNVLYTALEDVVLLWDDPGRVIHFDQWAG
ncbi:MAG TPA: hypothetical protein VL652_26725 [Kutzneria sp.]|nr:hypothetical protein [Kutzneria sp.]